MVTPVPHGGVRPRRKASVVSAAGDGTLTDADFGGCRWIEGDPKPPRSGMFCGLPAPSGESWCEKHRGVVFGENSPAESLPPDVAGGSAGGWRYRRGVGFSSAPNRHEH
jgi:hypothetical protein